MKRNKIIKFFNLKFNREKILNFLYYSYRMVILSKHLRIHLIRVKDQIIKVFQIDQEVFLIGNKVLLD